MIRTSFLTAIGGILAATALTAGGASAQGYGHQTAHQSYAPKTHVCYEKGLDARRRRHGQEGRD